MFILTNMNAVNFFVDPIRNFGDKGAVLSTRSYDSGIYQVAIREDDLSLADFYYEFVTQLAHGGNYELLGS